MKEGEGGGGRAGRQNGVDSRENGKEGVNVCDTEGAGKSQCESGSGSNVDVLHIKHTHTHQCWPRGLQRRTQSLKSAKFNGAKV